MASAVTRVVHRCEEAKETRILGIGSDGARAVMDEFFRLRIGRNVKGFGLWHGCLAVRDASKSRKGKLNEAQVVCARSTSETISRKPAIIDQSTDLLLFTQIISLFIIANLSFFFLDLSECQLVRVPDAVYHLMRHTELKCCNLSSNVITKISPKFSAKFSLITGNFRVSLCLLSSYALSVSELNLSRNQMSKLPDEFSDLEQLETLDISHNSFISMPHVVFKIPQLKKLCAQQNRITGEGNSF